MTGELCQGAQTNPPRLTQIFAAIVTADVIRGDYLDPQLGRTTFAVFAERWTATRRHLAQATRDHDRYLLGAQILPAFGDRPVASLRQSEIAAWLSELDVAPSTKAKCLQKFSAVMMLAVADGALKANPADGVNRPNVNIKREGRALTDEEVLRILEAAEKVDQETAVMVWLMARAGLRIGEVLALKRRDVDIRARLLHVRGSMSRREGVRPVKGRNGLGRTNPVSEDLAQRLSMHMAERWSPSTAGS